VLDARITTVVFPLNFGGVVPLEPQPVVIAMPNSIVRMIRKECDDAEGAEGEATFMESSKRPLIAQASALIFGRAGHYKWREISLLFEKCKRIKRDVWLTPHVALRMFCFVVTKAEHLAAAMSTPPSVGGAAGRRVCGTMSVF